MVTDEGSAVGLEDGRLETEAVVGWNKNIGVEDDVAVALALTLGVAPVDGYEVGYIVTISITLGTEVRDSAGRAVGE